MGGGLENALRPLANFESDGFIKLVIDIEQLICAQSIAHEGGVK
jgi:mercuric reductase